jgi:hypothetical protein
MPYNKNARYNREELYMDQMRRVGATVAIDGGVLNQRLRDLHGGAGAELAGLDVGNMNIRVPLNVNGEEVTTTIDLATLNGAGQFCCVVLRLAPDQSTGRPEVRYYTIDHDGQFESAWKPRQDCLVVDGDEHVLVVDSFVVASLQSD